MNGLRVSGFSSERNMQSTWATAVCVGCLAAWCTIDRTAGAGQSAAKDAEPVAENLAGELPRIPPVPAAEALTTFRVADGFRMELAAAEPEVVDPVALDFDENGRLFVAEMRDYSEQGDELLGRVRLLEDRDADGRYEH